MTICFAGFYYMSNAIGRLVGTLASGALYEFADETDKLVGFAACFWVSTGFCIVSAIVPLLIPGDGEAGLACGMFQMIKGDQTMDPPNQAAPSKVAEDGV